MNTIYIYISLHLNKGWFSGLESCTVEIYQNFLWNFLRCFIPNGCNRQLITCNESYLKQTYWLYGTHLIMYMPVANYLVSFRKRDRREHICCTNKYLISEICKFKLQQFFYESLNSLSINTKKFGTVDFKIFQFYKNIIAYQT